MRVVKCRITEQPKSLFDPIPRIYVTLEGTDEEIYLFSYYPDEVSFTESELIGLTIEECHTLFGKKDREFLKS